MSQRIIRLTRNAPLVRLGAWLFFGSLVVRLAFCVPVVRGPTPVIWDEYEYFERAVGFRNILSGLLRGSLPSSEDLAQAYASLWPPMQALVLSLGFLAFGSNLAVGRLMMVTLSAATTPLVYLVTSRLSDRRAALAASVVFAIYPSFIHYSHQLLSETTYIFLFFLALYAAMVTVEAAQMCRQVCLAVVTGCLLGLCTLTRAAGLLLSPAVALWTGWRSAKAGRILLPAVILISTAVALLPWEVVLYAVEGRFVAVTTSGDLNLYLANNPWLPEGYGSWGTAVGASVRQAASEYSQQHGVGFYQACRALALQEITQHPVAFFVRGLYKLRATWSADFPLLRRILTMVYPPMREELAGLVWVVTACSLFALLALAAWGLWVPAPALRYRVLILAIVLAGTAPSFVTIGQPRFSVPLLAALLPAAGHGMAHLKWFTDRGSRLRAGAGLLSVALISAFIYTGFPMEYRKIEPSSHYLNLARQLDRWFHHQAVVGDRLLFRVAGDDSSEQVTLSIVGDEFTFAGSGAQTVEWDPSSEAGMLDLVVRSASAREPFQLRLSSSPGLQEQAAMLSLDDEAWQTWQPSTLPGVEYMWVGSSQYPAREPGEAPMNYSVGESAPDLD
jgi:4-amino-4-deoxy-L-arabinose transferase-like glycosyltransferase